MRLRQTTGLTNQGEGLGVCVIFKRIVSQEILDVLNGPLAGVVSFVREQPSPPMFDLRLGMGNNARLYYAGYLALEISGGKHGLCLKVGDPRRPGSGFNPEWCDRLEAAKWVGEVPAVIAYLEKIPAFVEAEVKRPMREGAVQGRLCAARHDSMTIVDRESQFSFEGEAGGSSKRVIAEVAMPIAEALDAELEPASWTHTRKLEPGGELDCLAVDEVGRLLTIEVKPATEMGTGAWAAPQALIYAQLFDLWIRKDPVAARETLEGMIEQRVALGLSAPVSLDPEIPVVPVVAFGCPQTGETREHAMAVERAKTVAAAIERGCPEAPKVEWLTVEPDGSVKQL